MRILKIAAFALLAAALATNAHAQGVFLRAITPVGEGMAGVGAACPLDSGTAIYCNPATISAFQKSEMAFGLGAIIPQSELGIGQNDYKSSTGTLPAPSMSMIWKQPCSRITYGVAIAGVGGAAAMYPSVNATQLGLGGNRVMSSNIQAFQIMPTVAYAATKKLSVGVTPNLTIGKIEMNPSMTSAIPPNTPFNVGTRYLWGGGINAGIYYDTQCNWAFGFTVKSPTWIEPVVTYYSTGAAPNATTDSHALNIDLPMIFIAGVSYTGICNTIIGLDVKYIDYASTPGFKDDVLGWNSVLAVGVGAEHKLTDRIRVRGGYSFNENPIPSRSVVNNMLSPLTMSHSIHMGASYMFARDWDAHLAWGHAFKTHVDGVTPGNTPIRIAGGGDTLAAGLTKKF